MSNLGEEIVDIFFISVNEKVKEGIEYRDAVQLVAVTMQEDITRLVSSAISKYQEATYIKNELSHQPNVDECALASMGKLWHGENFEGNSEQMVCTLEETFLDVLYLALKYAKSDMPLHNALKINEGICGDKVTRERWLKKALLSV